MQNRFFASHLVKNPFHNLHPSAFPLAFAAANYFVTLTIQILADPECQAALSHKAKTPTQHGHHKPSNEKLRLSR